MLHTEAKYRCTIVVSDLLLFRVEAYTLADDSWFGTSGTPDRVGHFEANGEDTLPSFTGTITESMSVDDEQAMVRRGRGKAYLPASLFADVVPSCSGGT